MAFTSFYLVAGGTGAADINAGSSTGAAQATTTNGNWNSGTGVFIATGGTPFAATTTSDYASIYVDGATVTTYVAKVKTVTSSTQITVDTTIAYGTAPTTNGTLRSCTINGAWNTEQVLAAGGLATFTVPQSTKINIKGNLTITANRTISMAGAATAPLWFSGYNTNPGDLDADTTNSLAKPIWTLNSTVTLTTSGTLATWSSLAVTGSVNGNLWTMSGSVNYLVRCRATNTNSGTSSVAYRPTGATSFCAYSYFKTPSTATALATVNIGNTTNFVGCVFDTGGIAGMNVGGSTARLMACVFLNNVGSGILASTGIVGAVNCTFYGCTVDGVKWTLTPGVNSYIVGCLFSGLNGSTATTNGINNASGTNTDNVFRACNDYYNVTNPEVGMGDSFAFFPQTDSNAVATSGTDMSPVSGSNAIHNGFPGIFENESFSSFPNIGAVLLTQAQTSGYTPQVFE